MIDKLQPVLDARAAVGNLREIVLAQHLLVLETERAMVGRNHLQVVVLQAVPQFRLVLLLAQRRREDILRAFEILAAPWSSIESSRYCGQVSANAGTPRSRASRTWFSASSRRQMHDVNRRARHLRHGDGAMHGFGFGQRRARERVIDRRGLAFGQRLLHDHVDHAAVLGVHADQRAVLRGLLQARLKMVASSTIRTLG